jgi:cell division protein FtsW (lipid II flippase)
MIKIFGKIRYHWQPDLTTSIIYWSATFTIFFISIVLTLEKTHVYWLTFIIFAVFLFFVVMGFHRYFFFNKFGEIEIVSIFQNERGIVLVNDITEIRIFPYGIILYDKHFPKGRVFYMKSWHKTPFLQELEKQEGFHAKMIDIEHVEF